MKDKPTLRTVYPLQGGAELRTPGSANALNKTHWPHAPLHLLKDQGVYIVTAGTYLKAHYFNTDKKRQLLHDHLISLSQTFGWELHAWAVFSNHYHFVAKSPKDPTNLKIWIAQLHYLTSHEINTQDCALNRKVWHQYWDTKITIQTSYLARLNYVHQNPVKHQMVSKAADYPWCSAAQFEGQASHAFIKSVYSFDYTKVKAFDEF